MRRPRVAEEAGNIRQLLNSYRNGGQMQVFACVGREGSEVLTGTGESGGGNTVADDRDFVGSLRFWRLTLASTIVVFGSIAL
jgi:hypothetical protein